jgi:hypothetical protein
MNSSGLVFSPRPWCSWASGSIRLPLQSMPAWQHARALDVVTAHQAHAVAWLSSMRCGEVRWGGTGGEWWRRWARRGGGKAD